MSILLNAQEIDRLYVVSDQAERETSQARAVVDKATVDAARAESIREATNERINDLFDGIASSIPSTINEAFALAVLLDMLVDGSVFLQDDTKARERADKIISNLLSGLSSLASVDGLPNWLKNHVAEDGLSRRAEQGAKNA